MSFDISLDANRIATDWPIIVGELPARLAGAIAAFRVAEASVPPAGGINLEGVNAENADKAVLDLAEALVLGEKFYEAKQAVVNRLARRVLGAASESVAELIERLKPEFDTAVTEFQAAVEGLPGDHSPAALIAAGPSAVTAYHRAVTAQGRLNKFAGWLDTLYDLPVFRGRRRESALKLLRPSSRAEFKLLLDAQDGGDLNGVYLAAVEAGCTWKMNTPAEAQAIADEINALPVVRNPNLRFARW